MIIRVAIPGDEIAIHQLIVELAVYEKEPDAVANTPELLAIDLFKDKVCHAFVAEIDHQIVGFALYYFSYSTWKGRALYLEDIYIKEDFRNRHIGNQLFDKVVEEGLKAKVKRIDWQVLNWNEPAIAFYKKKNATLDPDWINGRLHIY
ncbi:MAG: GNAT family N-acetyltransferase [Crocinitomicaceae bacterium]